MTIIQIGVNIIFKLIVAIAITVLVNKLDFFNNSENNNNRQKGKKLLVLGVWISSASSILSLIGGLLYGIYGEVPFFSIIRYIGIILAILGIALCIISKTKKDNTTISKTENSNETTTEKISTKGVFGGDIIPKIIWGLAAITFCIFFSIEMSSSWDGIMFGIGIWSAIVLVIIGLIFKVILEKRELIITNKRVIARGAFGYRTDLPIEKVTDVSMCFFNGIGCASPSAKIKFHFCKNKMEVFDTIVAETLQRDSKYK
jgi:protein-S-isoprenylcysteine O-methyltransferase Ste14